MGQRRQTIPLLRVATMGGSAKAVRSGQMADSRRGATLNYKPFILRTAQLSLLFIATFALIAILQYALEKLPQGSREFASLSSRSQIFDGRIHFHVPRSNTVLPSSDLSQIPSTKSTLSASSPSLSPNTLLSSTAQVPPTLTTAESAYLQTQTIITTPTTNSPSVSLAVSTTAQTAYVQDTTQNVAPTTTGHTQFATTSVYIETEVSTVTGFTAGSGSSIAISSSSVMTSTGLISESSVKTTIEPILVTTKSTTHAPSGSRKSSSPTSSAESSNGNVTDASSDHTTLASHTWSPKQTFLATYLPVLVAVIFRVFLTILYNSMNLIDPFRQLSHSQGGPASQAFFATYQNPSTILGPVAAIRHCRWTLGAVSLAYLMACFLPALAAETVFVDTKWDCPFPGSGPNPCPARVACFPLVIRVSQCLLALIAAVIVVLIIILLRSKTGLSADPSSIATIASLMRHPGLIEDLSESADGELLDISNLKTALHSKRYGLRAWKSADGEGYGIVPLDSGEHDYHAGREHGPRYVPIDGGKSTPRRRPQAPHHFRYADFILAFVLAGTFGVVLAYLLDSSDDGFNRFFNSTDFGSRFILTGAGTLIAASWKSIEQSSVVMAPYVRLADRPFSAGSTILFTPSNTPLLSTFRAFRARYFLVAVITIATVTAEALNIVISGVPFASGEKWIQLLVSSYMSLVILGFMMIVLVLVMLYRRKEPHIPNRPDSLAGKMSYLCGSRLVDDFEGMERLAQSARDDEIRRRRKMYFFGIGQSKDGRTTWVINDVQGLGNIS